MQNKNNGENIYIKYKNKPKFIKKKNIHWSIYIEFDVWKNLNWYVLVFVEWDEQLIKFFEKILMEKWSIEQKQISYKALKKRINSFIQDQKSF